MCKDNIQNICYNILLIDFLIYGLLTISITKNYISLQNTTYNILSLLYVNNSVVLLAKKI